MGSTQDGQRLARVAKLNLMLQEPENRIKASSIVQALLVHNVSNTQKELERIDGEIQKIRDICAAQGDHRQDLAEKQDEIRKDVQGLRRLVEESGGLTQTRGADLESLTEKVNDLYSQQTAQNTKLSKDIEFMNQTIDSYQQDFDRMRETIESHESARVSAQREDIEKLRVLVTDMRTETDRMREELDRVPMGSQTQQQQQQLDTLEGIMHQQEQSSQFFEQLASRQSVFLDFLEKLPISAVVESKRAAAAESEANELVNGTPTPTLSTSTSTSTPTLASSPAPPDASTEQPVSAEIMQFWKTFSRYRKSYRARAPRSEASFIRYFLKNLDPAAAAFVEARLRHDGQQQAPIDLGKLTWARVEKTVRNMDIRELQDAITTTRQPSASSSSLVPLESEISMLPLSIPPPPSPPVPVAPADATDPAAARRSKRRKGGR